MSASVSTEPCLIVTEDRMMVLLASVGQDHDPMVLTNWVLEEMARQGLRLFPERADLLKRISTAIEQAANTSQTVNDVFVAAGRPAVPSRNALMEWAQNFFSSGYETDPKTGRIDYRRPKAQANVEAGQPLARLQPAVEGQSGMDVYGARIAVTRPVRLRVRVGPGVAMEESEGVQHFRASQSGRLRWAQETLAVDNVLQLRGDVGLVTGDIKHLGAVVVEGDVRAGSTIEAAGDVEIMGTVDPADITTGGGLNIHGGLSGAAGRRIKVAGSLQVRFVQDAAVTVGGNATVVNEIRNTDLVVRGVLKVPEGRVVGGRVRALGGLILRQAGSDAHVATLLEAGLEEDPARARARMQSRIALLERLVNRLHTQTDPLMHRGGSMSPELRRSLNVLRNQLTAAEKEIVELRQALETLSADEEVEGPKVLVQGRVFAETIISIRGERLVVTDDLIGPLCVKLRDGHIEMHGMGVVKLE